MAKLSKKEQARRDEDIEAKLTAYEAHCAKYHNKEFNACVIWFDEMRGEGMVAVENLPLLPIYACNIQGKKTWYPETACVSYKKGQKVLVRLNLQYSAAFVIGLTPGHFDQTKWDSLDQDKLAFKCNEEGEAINGLWR